MTGRLLAILSVLAVTGLSALSLGGPVFYFVSWALALMILYAIISLLGARFLCALPSASPPAPWNGGTAGS